MQSDQGVYWPPDFLDEVENEQIDDGIAIWCAGGPSLILRTAAVTIYVDPFFGTIPEHRRSIAIPIDPRRVRMADLLLSTHRHVDHCHQESLVPIARNTGALSAGPASSTEATRGFRTELPKWRELRAGDRLAFGGTDVFALPAQDPWEEHALTYLVRSGGVGVFIGGDTRGGEFLTDIGSRFGVNAAFLAFSEVHMEPEEVIESAQRLGAKLAVPYHWELFHGWTRSPLEFCGLTSAGMPELRLLFLGDRLWLPGKPPVETAMED